MPEKIPLQPLRGMRDILHPDAGDLVWLANTFRDVAKLYGYVEVMPPTLERFALFALKSGEEIRRTMYVFKDKAGREVALRPEVTASVARMYLDKMRGLPKPVRVMYVANCFRYEEPQHARYREFYQAGVELIGSSDILGDAETMSLLDEFLGRAGLEGYRFKVDNVGIHRAVMRRAGIPEEEQDRVLHLMDKKLYEEAIAAARRAATDRKMVDVLAQLAEGPGLNELREVLSGISEAMEEAERLRSLVDILSGAMPGRIHVDLSFARGLAYYTGIIYEVEVPELGVSVAGGGRYDTLIELYGGEPTPSTGFAAGLDRLLLALRMQGRQFLSEKVNRVLIIPLIPEAEAAALILARRLHEQGVQAELYHGRTRRLGKALSYASDAGYRYTVIIGRAELEEGAYTLRDMESREQRRLSLEELVESVSRRT